MKGRLISQVGRLILVTQKNFLGSLGIELTDKEKEKLLKTLPIDAAGKVYQNGLLKGMKSLSANGMIGLKEVMDGVKATTGVVVDVKYVKTILKNMGIEFTDKEHLKLMKNLPFNGGKVNINNLDTTLSNLGIKLADTELKDLAKNMHIGV
ncbi:uncharacterized protein AAEQ78_013124 isoform 3-T4 [Lycaon pictus]